MGSWTGTKRFVATGDTYPHRETLTSWAWHWDPDRKAWIEDNGSEEDELCIVAIKNLPGVTVTVEELEGPLFSHTE
jgi:hypothetical protein